MKILLAIDGSTCSEVATDEIAQRPWPADSQVRIITVVEPHGPLTANMNLTDQRFVEAEEATRELAREAVERTAATLRGGEASRRLQVSADVLTGSPKRLIVEDAESWGADLIVVGSHGYRSWERMLLGSVSQAVAMHAECSVEIVRRQR